MRFNHAMIFFMLIDYYKPHDIYSHNNCLGPMLITSYYKIRYKVCPKEMK